MTKEEFLDEIKKELGFMPYEEVIKAEKYFESYFLTLSILSDISSSYE